MPPPCPLSKRVFLTASDSHVENSVPTESGSLQELLHLQDQKQKQNYSALLQNYSALLLLQRLLVLLLLLLIQVLLLTQVLLLSLTFFNRSSYKTEDLDSTGAPFETEAPNKSLIRRS